MLATVSPCSANLDETLATLRYALQARNIVNTVRVNEAPQDRVIRELRAEVQRLRDLQLDVERAKLSLVSPPIVLSPKPNPQIKKQIAELEVELQEVKERVQKLQAEVEEKDKLIAEKEENLSKAGEKNRSLEEEIECLREREAGNQSHVEDTVKMIELELFGLRETLTETQTQLEERNAKFREAEEVLREVEKRKVSVERELRTLRDKELENRRNLEESAERNDILRRELEETEAVLNERENELRDWRNRWKKLERELEDRNNAESDTRALELDYRNLKQNMTEIQKELHEKDIKLRQTEDILGEIERQKVCAERDCKTLRDQETESRRKIEETVEKNIILQGQLEGNKALLAQKEKEMREFKESRRENDKMLESVKRERDLLKMRLEHLRASKENLKTEIAASSGNLIGWQEELGKLQESYQKLVEDNLKVLKGMEKSQNLHHEEVLKREEIVTENKKLKEELTSTNERLNKKTVIVEKLKTKLKILEELLNSGDFNRNKNDQKPSHDKTDYEIKMYEIVMETAYPFHWEHLMRKARTYGEKYNIPYEFELGEAIVNVKHLILKAKTSWNRIHFGKWIEKIENDKTWSREMDKSINWKVDFGDYFDCNDQRLPSSPETDIDNPESAINIGSQLTKNGCICPRAWRKTLVKRHVMGMKDDSNALTKHFAASGDCKINIILSRLNALINRLEVLTELMES